MLPLWDTFYSEDFRSLPDSRSFFARNSRPLNGYLRVLFEHRNVGHRQKRNPTLPVLSERPVLLSKRISELSSPDSIIEPNDMGHSGISTAIAHRICTSSCRRFIRVYRYPCRTLAGVCLARDYLLHLVLETLAGLLTNPVGNVYLGQRRRAFHRLGIHV